LNGNELYKKLCPEKPGRFWLNSIEADAVSYEIWKVFAWQYPIDSKY
jgi:hypothetical protein